MLQIIDEHDKNTDDNNDGGDGDKNRNTGHHKFGTNKYGNIDVVGNNFYKQTIICHKF